MNNTHFLRAGNLPLVVLVEKLQSMLRPLPAGATITVEAPNPDLFTDRYSGERITTDGDVLTYRDYRTWFDLAEGLGCALRTPTPVSPSRIHLHLRKLDTQGWHSTSKPSGDAEKYGVDSTYSRTRRTEEPSLLLGLQHGLRQLALPTGATILALGANQGDELSLIDALLVQRGTPAKQLVGLDHSASAVARGRQRFSDPRYTFVCADLRDPLPVGQFDLVMAIHVLHSPALDTSELLGRIVREHRTAEGGLMIGLPNSRHVDHRLRFGSHARHCAHPEQSVLIKQASHMRRMLQRRGFCVTLTGKHTLLLTARWLG